MRAFVIVLMALDHVRDYFTAARLNPLDRAPSLLYLLPTLGIGALLLAAFPPAAGSRI